MTESPQQALSPAQRERAYRHNFPLFLADSLLFTLGMIIISPTTVIPDFIRTLTSSEILIGMTSSMFEFGWMVPQLFMARLLVRVNHKKWWFVGPNIPVRFAMLTFAVLLMVFGADRPEIILLAFFICYGVAAVGDGIVGVPWVDLAASSLDNRRRALALGLTVAVSGMIMLGVAPLTGQIIAHEEIYPNNYALIFAVAGLLFVLSIVPFLFVKELPGGKAVQISPPFRVFISQLGTVLRQDKSYRAMIITRIFSSLFIMASPFYIGFATQVLGLSSGVAVGNLLLMQVIGNIVGALLYAWMGNRHNLLYVRLAILTAALLPVSALLAGNLGPVPLYLGFFASGMAFSNLFNGYLNWVIMYATPDQLPIYTGLFNTMAAFSLLFAPVIGGLIVQTMGYQAVFIAALIMMACAFFVVTRHVQEPVRRALVPDEIESCSPAV